MAHETVLLCFRDTCYLAQLARFVDPARRGTRRRAADSGNDTRIVQVPVLVMPGSVVIGRRCLDASDLPGPQEVRHDRCDHLVVFGVCVATAQKVGLARSV